MVYYIIIHYYIMSDFSKIKYWYDKLPEMKSNIEPLTQLMIRTTGEVNNYMNHHAHTKIIKIVNSKDINLLHSIDRAPAIKKLLDRVHFLKKTQGRNKNVREKKWIC